MNLSEAEHVTEHARQELGRALPNLDAFDILTTTSSGPTEGSHDHSE